MNCRGYTEFQEPAGQFSGTGRNIFPRSNSHKKEGCRPIRSYGRVRRGGNFLRMTTEQRDFWKDFAYGALAFIIAFGALRSLVS